MPDDGDECECEHLSKVIERTQEKAGDEFERQRGGK